MNQRQRTNHLSVGKHPDRLTHPALSAGRLGHAEEPSDEGIADGFSHTIRRFLLPLAVTVFSGGIFTTALSVAAWNSADPTAWIPLLSPIVLGLAALAGGITAGKCCKERAVGGSFMSGCLFAAILCLLALLAGKGEQGLASWLIRLATIPVHGIGGFLSRPRKRPAAHTAGKHPSHHR